MKWVALTCSTSKTTGPICSVKRSVWAAPLSLSTSVWDIDVGEGVGSAALEVDIGDFSDRMEIVGVETTVIGSTWDIDAVEAVSVCMGGADDCGGSAVRDNGTVP